MTKMFKNSKHILAVIMAFAILAVSLFVGNVASINAEACAAITDTSKIVYWNGTKASGFAGGTGTPEDPYIIKTAEQLAYCCTGVNAKNSTGKFYKVDDSVKIFIMQPQSIVDTQRLLSLNSAQETKDYLDSLSGKKDWSSLGAVGFNGNFDGNGATVYGIWADGIATNKSDVGLFPRYDGGYLNDEGNVVANVCKNIAVRNSYFSSTRRIGAISGASYGTGYDGKIDGIIHYDTIAVVNCYITANASNTSHYGEEAIVVDGGALDVSTLNNCLVKGNYAYNTAVGKNMAIIAAGRADGNMDSNGDIVKSKLSNSVILGADPFRREEYYALPFQNHKGEDGKAKYDFYDNVITDQPAGKVTSSTTTVEFPEEQVKQITETGFAFKEAATSLDWENTWFMSEDGPELRAFHGNISLVQTATTHYYVCDTCASNTEHTGEAHNWDAEYKCVDCGWQCTHGSQTVGEFRTGDCVTQDGYYTECHYCTWSKVEYVGVAAGHTLTWVDEILADCENEGREGYWHCTECNGNFTADSEEAAKWASMDTNIADPDTMLITPIAPHNATNRADGSIIVVQDGNSGHYWICYTCDGKLLAVESEKYADDGRVKKHKYEDGVCVDCAWECPEHDYQPSGIVYVVGDCDTDREEELKCTNCGDKKIEVTPAGHNIVKYDEVAPTDKLEGTKAHYACTECKEIYTDAEGKNKATSASLVIPKILPPEYQNQIQGNVDTSDKSPATGDNVASVIAFAALAGAALVITRKIKK